MSLAELSRVKHAHVNLSDIARAFFPVTVDNASLVRNSIASTLISYWLENTPELIIDRNPENFGRKK